jgi:hypothetical protein
MNAEPQEHAMVTPESQNRSQSDPVADEGSRVEMKSAGAALGYVDGAWWPRSTDPAAEFPGLVRALHGSVGQVSRVAYNLDVWAPVHNKLTVDRHVVRCEGFHTMNQHTVTAIGADSRRVTLFVVDPSTPDRVARAALSSAAGQHSTATVEDLLAGDEARSDRAAAAPATPS